MVTMPRLDVYGVIVACRDEAAREALLKRNRKKLYQSSEGALPTGRGTGTARAQTEPADVKPDRRLCHVRQKTALPLRVLGADVVTKGAGQVGRRQAITLDIHHAGRGSLAEQRNYIDQFAFVLVNERTGARQRVPIKMSPPTAKERQAEARRKERIQALTDRINTLKQDPANAREVAGLRR